MPSPWIWEAKLHRYRHVATGRFLGPRQMVALRDAFVDAQVERMGVLARRLANSEINVYQWQQAMRHEIRMAYIDQYILGHGGRKTMMPTDWGRLGAEIRKQYNYLTRFVNDIEAGKYTNPDGTLQIDAIRARAELYMKSSRAAYEQGHAFGIGMPPLPAYPGDGTSECIANCRCYWSIHEVRDETRNKVIAWECRWVAQGDAESCPTCRERAQEWNPLRLINPLA